MCDSNTAARSAASIHTSESPRDPSEMGDVVTLRVSKSALCALFAAGNYGAVGGRRLSTAVALNALEHAERSLEAIRSLSSLVNGEDGLTELRFHELVWICEQQMTGAIGLVEAIENAEGAA